MNDNALAGALDADAQPPLESLRDAPIMLVAARLFEAGPLEATLRAAGAITERVHPRDNWRWLFFEHLPRLLVVFVSEDESGGGVTADALMHADLVAHAPVVALTLPGAQTPSGGVSTSMRSSTRPDLIAAQAAQLLADHAPAVSLRAGNLALDADGTRFWIDGRPVACTPTEYALLAYLLTNRSRVLTHERILAEVWPRGDAPSARAISVHLTRLRAKLAGAAGVRITAMRGVGYCLDLAVSA